MTATRAASFLAGAVAIVAVSALVLGGDERDRICRPGAAQAGRPSPEAWLRLRKLVFQREGVNFAALHAEYETDHIVPRCLDGPSTLDNLQLQLWPRARIKDVLEAETCRAYCAGKITLDEARAKFRRD